MSNRIAKKAPIVRLPPKSNVELLLLRSAQVAVIVMGLVTVVFALHAGEYILAPASLGIVLGLMLGPVATKLERRGLRPGISASLVVILFIVAICLFAAAVAAPLSFWLSRLPQLWSDLQLQLTELKAPLDALKSVRDQLRELTGGEGLTVSVDEGVGVESMAILAPAFVAQILIFFACLYFFVATRNQTRPPFSSFASTGACAGASRIFSATSKAWCRATCSPSPSSTSQRGWPSASPSI